MAHQTLAVLPLIDFHTFTDQVTAVVDAQLFPACWGEEDGYACREKATVHHLACDIPLCGKHFREVSRG